MCPTLIPELAAGLTTGNPINLVYMGGLSAEILVYHGFPQTTIEHHTITGEM